MAAERVLDMVIDGCAALALVSLIALVWGVGFLAAKVGITALIIGAVALALSNLTWTRGPDAPRFRPPRHVPRDTISPPVSETDAAEDAWEKEEEERRDTGVPEVGGD